MIKILSTEERVAIARDYLARVFNGSNAEARREFFTPDVVWHGGALGRSPGSTPSSPFFGGSFGALTGIKAEVQDVHREQGSGRLCVSSSARPTPATCSGSPATGRRVQWDAVDIYRVRDAERSANSGRSRIWLRS